MARTPRTCHCGSPIRRGPGRHTYCSDECRPDCAFDGCLKPARGAGTLCESHRMQIRRGESLKPPRWATEWVCVVCGSEVAKGSGRRKHCSGRCQMLESLNPGRPKSFACVRCGIEVSLIDPSTRTGQFKRSDSTQCDKCKGHKRYGITTGELAKRDGTDCKICGDRVDLAADKRDLFRGSVDHITPKALGGSDDPENLQLAHLWCNQVKHAREGFTLVRMGGEPA